MAKASFNFALESLFKVISNEKKLLEDAGFRVQLLSNDLKTLQEYIQESVSHDEGNINVIKRLRDAAHEAEDLINKYAVKVARYKSREWVGKKLHGVGHGFMVRNMPKKIKRIEQKVDRLCKSREKFRREGGVVEDAGARPNEDAHVKNFINFAADITKMEKMLEDEMQRGRRVISIIGMGGSGKTALILKLCQYIREKKYFECVVAVTIEQKTPIDDVLRKIISNLAPQSGGAMELGLINAQIKMKEKEVTLSESLQRLDRGKLKEILLQYLQGKRYLVVIDNVWESRSWGSLLEAFPEDKNRSRIIITTRRNGVANITNSPIHFISHLDDTHGGQLFCTVVFDSNTCPGDLEDPKNKVVKISRGLPIVIVELGRVLAEKERSADTWNAIIKNENSYPDEGRKQWRDKLALSYEQIEIYKKFCFFYFGLFSADSDIPVRQLIQLWIAEEFIPHKSDTTLERVAEECLEELIERCLIQPARWRLDGGVKACRIHNVLRDLCRYESQIEEFLEVIHDDSDLSSKPRRLSLHCSTPHFIQLSSSGCNTSSVRSLLCFGKDENNPFQKDHLRWLCENIRMLRVLKLGDEEVDSIPKRIRKLYLLKYLQLKGTHLIELPDSICELLNLVTLDLRGSSVNRLPSRIWELQNLRHFYNSEPTKLPHPSDKSKIFPSLQIFSWLDLDKDTLNLIAEGKLPLVRKLGLYTQLSKDQIHRKHFESLSHLERLKVRAPSSQRPSFDWSFLGVFESLTKLTFLECKVNFEVLEDLPKLAYLKVHKGINSTGNILEFREGKFAQLLGFQMAEFPIENWKISEGAILRLQRLIIRGCKNLEVQREELQHLTLLKKLHVHHPCTTQLVEIVQQMKSDQNMVDRCDIQLYDPSQLQETASSV